jgi:outer membrane biosynthesis protein TonB
MRTGVTISSLGHAAILAWSVLTFVAKPNEAKPITAMPVDIISASDFSQVTAGTRTALNLETPKPFVEKISDPKPTEDPNAKVATRDVKAAAETPPAPAPKPPAPAESKPEPKRDLIAEAIKKDDAKKPEPKRAEPKVPTPPKKATTAPQPMFDPRQLQALLDKRDPQRLAATGDAIHTGVSLGAPSTIGAQLSQSELDALRARLGQLWNPPAGASNPDELVVLVRIQLGPDGKLTAPPMVLTRGNSALYMAARDGAVRAIFRGQPFDMLKPEHYDQWKDIEITFDPRDMIRG